MSGEHNGRREALAVARTYGEALRLAVEWLRAEEASQSPELDARVLLGHVTGAGRAALLAYPERALTEEQARAFAGLVARRVAREPVAYLIGRREFMGMEFLTDARALIPRPETELLVEAALKEIRGRLAAGAMPVVADIGTGSGAIAVSVAALEPQLTRVYATDVSQDALALAEENARRLGVAERVTLLRGNLLEPLPERLDVLLANLPYVAPRDAETLARDVRSYEPALALYGADDGLGHLRTLFAQAPAHLESNATLILEFGYDQRGAVVALARETFPGCNVTVGADYAGWDRYAIIRADGAADEAI